MIKNSSVLWALGRSAMLALLASSALAVDDEPAPAGAGALGDSVVKVFATQRSPDLGKPWSKQAPAEVTGSGVVIEGHRILTNAHVVMYASQVQVQANQAGDKLSATVAAIAPGIDLAVLTLDDDSFFAGHAPLARADGSLHIKDTVLAYGYPTGGTSLSITKGIVSRIEFVPYNFSVSGLRIQVDAAINAGNSGGAAIVGDRMIGLVFSRAGGDTQNIGYIIPNEEIDLFLRDIADGHYDGKPAMFDELQTLQNRALREFLHIDKSVTGILVHHPRLADPSYPLKEWDVITQIGDWPIDDQGNVRLNDDIRVAFQYRVQQVAHDGIVPLGIIRAGRKMQVQLPAVAVNPSIIQPLAGEYPSYFIYGPLVFTRASTQLLLAYAENAKILLGLAYLNSPLLSNLRDPPDSHREDVVVVASPFFPSDLTKGYENPAGMAIDTVNGVHIKGLAHLVATLRDLTDTHVVFGFARRGGESLVFPRAEMVKATEGILADNGIRAQGSADMLAVWQQPGRGKPADAR